MKRVFLGVLLAVLMVFGVVAPKAYAVDSEICGDSSIEPELKAAAGCNDSNTVKTPLKTAIGVLLWFVGIVSVVMIIVSGIKMTTSAGNPQAVQKAKNTLIYALVGLAIALLAYAIVKFVIGQVG